MRSYRSAFTPDLLKEQTIVITGGGSGIGENIAHEVAAIGGRAIIVGRTRENLARVQSEILAAGGDCSHFVCDLKHSEQIADLMNWLEKEQIEPSALVNNAGGQFLSSLEDISQNGFQAVMRLNCFAGIELAQLLFKKFFKPSGGGKIVNMVADFFDGMPMMGHSGAARAAMENFSKTAAIEWGRFGVNVNAIAPGYIKSSGLEKYPAHARPMIEQLYRHVPLGRLGTTDEVSAAVCFLLSPAASYINGSTLRVDGGSSLMFGPWKLPDPVEGITGSLINSDG